MGINHCDVEPKYIASVINMVQDSIEYLYLSLPYTTVMKTEQQSSSTCTKDCQLVYTFTTVLKLTG